MGFGWSARAISQETRQAGWRKGRRRRSGSSSAAQRQAAAPARQRRISLTTSGLFSWSYFPLIPLKAIGDAGSDDVAVKVRRVQVAGSFQMVVGEGTIHVRGAHAATS